MDSAAVQRFLDGMKYEAGRAAPPPGFPRLADLPAGRYVDSAFLAIEARHLWKSSWLYACHIDELPAAGSYLLWKKAGSPILIVRGKDDGVRAFYNTCRHRGGPLVKQTSGTQEGFTCGYHGWTYTLDGRLIGLRDQRDFVGLELAGRSLIPVRAERFYNWIFVNENPEAQPLLEHVAPFHEFFRQFAPERIRWVAHEAFNVECNVKLLLEAFLEVYHLKSIHPGTADRFLDHRGTTIALYRNGHSLMVTPNRRPDWVDPGTRGLPRAESATVISARNNLSFNFYPNLVVPVDPAGCPFLTFWPTSNSSTRIECTWFAPDWDGGPLTEMWKTRIANFDRILDEDLQFAARMQQSVMSPGFRGVPLNYQERRIYHWHEELDRRIGRDNVPVQLRVEPVLERYYEN
jgi:phenylpropionate dioxygenase-like ring-hydroxylating dioxygenase large terminal subunit